MGKGRARGRAKQAAERGGGHVLTSCCVFVRLVFSSNSPAAQMDLFGLPSEPNDALTASISSTSGYLIDNLSLDAVEATLPARDVEEYSLLYSDCREVGGGKDF